MRLAAAGVASLVTAVLGTFVSPAAADPDDPQTMPVAPEIARLDDEKRVPVGSRAKDKIRVRPAGSIVLLQQRDENREWQKVGRFTSKKGTAITLRYPEAELGPQRFRVVPVSRNPDQSGAPAKVTITGYQVQATLQGWTGGQEYATKGTRQVRFVRASPAGATAQLQRRGAKSSRWKVVNTRKVRADGQLRINAGRTIARTRKFRVVIPRQETVGKRLVSEAWTVVGYGKVPPTGMLPDLLNKLVAPLGIPQVYSSSVSSPTTARATCVAGELSGMRATRAQPGRKLRAKLLATKSLRGAPAGMVSGVNVSVRCQAAYFVRNGRVLRAVPVSTGQSGYRTDLGTYRIFRGVNGVETSLQFPDDHWNMYRSLYFNNGEALHGSYSDSYVRTYPDSHGCVRMLHRDIDWLWRNGWTIGTTVRVYGTWA